MTIVLAVSLLVTAAPASAHLFNHQDRHEVCEAYLAPAVHGLADGHVHWHHLDAAPEAHAHGGTLFPAGHTHADVFHDPCDQAGMLHVAFEDAPAFDAPPLPALIIAKPARGLVTLVLRDAREAVQLPVPVLTQRDELVILGDADLARFPGSGTVSDPYVIEGYHIRNVLMVKDTSKCVVLRNNVVYNDVVRGPLVDPGRVVDVREIVAALTAQLDAALANLTAARAAVAANLPAFDALRLEKEELMAESDAMKLAWEALLAQVAADADAARSARLSAKATMREIRDTTGDLRDALAAQNVTLPADPPASTEPGDPLFGSFLSQVDEASSAAQQDATIAALRDELAALRAEYATEREALDAANAALAASRAARDAYRPGWDAFKAERDAWLDLTWRPARDAHLALVDGVQAARAGVGTARALLADAQARLADHVYEYLGHVFDTLDELAGWAIGTLPAPEQQLAGRMILDWNGQCVHAYHNVIQDLRVNRNNARTGYATGGLIEDNRIFTVGQIRHFDGEFRENEVGSRLYIQEYLQGARSPAPLDPSAEGYAEDAPAGGPALVALKAGRAINADGFNEAWMHDNVIYGSVDLDLHGHHHGAGFFARESHYHGDLHDHAYMVNASSGSCLYTYAPEPGLLAPLGVEELDELDDVLAEEPGCLPHHDHAKRWTSVRFERNTILDPLGYGLRYEDQDHAGDDRIATSESMVELNAPHFHRTHVALSDNVILGSLWIDVFNADGIKLWSDDHSKVRFDLEGAVLDTIEHPLAEIIDSHPRKNDGWLDLLGNDVFLVDKAGAIRAGHDAWSALQVNDAKQLVQLDVRENDAFVLGRGFSPGVATAPALAQKLADLAEMDAPSAHALVSAWGGDHPNAARTQAILLRGVADSTVRVCGNEMLGFARGLDASDRIRPDVAFQDCGDNDWGSASPAWRIVTAPYPEEERPLLAPVRSAADGTPVEPHVHAATDHAGLLVPG